MAYRAPGGAPDPRDRAPRAVREPPEFTTRFVGWTRRESLPLLRYLFEFGTRPEFVTRFRWAPGSVAMWDNRQTWHFAVNDHQGQRRVMHRILLKGSPPVPAA